MIFLLKEVKDVQLLFETLQTSKIQLFHLTSFDTNFNKFQKEISRLF